MDRVLIYPSAIPQDLDLLNTNKNTMVALAMLSQALLGTSTYVDGLACTPTSPATLTVNVSGGSIYALEEIDTTGYGSIAADTSDQIVKQGIIIGTTNFSTPAPGTVGQSVVYLVEAAYQDTDGGSTVLPYYNSSNPSVPYSGPGNDGQPQNTVRQGVCHLALKTGVAATTGTQVTPSPDAGYVGLWAITVANGQSTVTSGNIAQLSTAPFISPKLTGMIAAVQAGSANSAHDTSGAANTITIALNPAVASLTDGMKVRVKVANTNTGAVVMNTNGLGNVSVVTPSGAALASGALVTNGFYDFTYDANGTRWVYDGSGNSGTVNNVFTGATTTGSANAQALSSVSPTATSFTNGQSIVCTAGYTNTGSATFQAPGGSAVTIKKDSGSGLTALTGGEISSGDTIILTYNSTGSCWVLVAGFPLGTAAYKTASDNTQTTVASVSGAITAGHVALFKDSSGTLQDGGAPGNVYQATPSNPTGTTSSTAVMMGLAGSITPNASGKVLIIISGDVVDSGSSGLSTIQIRYGTGTAPSNAAALTGTQAGSVIQFGYSSSFGEAGVHQTFTCNAIVTLTPGTTYWIDLAASNGATNTTNLYDVSISAAELR